MQRLSRDMTSFGGGAQKFTSSRKQEIRLKKELDAIRSKAVVDHYLKQQQSKSEQRELSDAVLTCAPRLPPVTAPKNDPTHHMAKPATSKQSHPYSLQPSEHKRTASGRMGRATSLEGAVVVRAQKIEGLTSQKRETKVAQKSQKPPSQKMVIDNLQERGKKFAILSSLNTSAPVRYVQREPKVMPAVKTEITLQNAACKPQEEVRRGGHESKVDQKRPESQATTVTTASYSKASETSYQRYMISQATATPGDPNTPTEMAISRDQSNLQSLSSLCSDSTTRYSQQPSLLADSSQSSFQDGLSSDSHQSINVPSGDRQQMEPQLGGSALLFKYEGQTENENDNAPQGSYAFYNQPPDSATDATTSAQLSRLQSGALKLEIDMRFDTETADTIPAYLESRLESGLEGLDSGLIASDGNLDPTLTSELQVPTQSSNTERLTTASGLDVAQSMSAVDGDQDTPTAISVGDEVSTTGEAESQSTASMAASLSQTSVTESQSRLLQTDHRELDLLKDLRDFPPKPCSTDAMDLNVVASQYGSGFISGSEIQPLAKDTLSANFSESIQQDFKSDQSRSHESGMEPTYSQSSLASQSHSHASETLSTKSLIQCRSESQIISPPLQSSNSSQKSSETTTHSQITNPNSRSTLFMDKFSTPFAGSFSSLGEPFWFHSQSITSGSDQCPATASPSASTTSSGLPDGTYSSQLLKDQRENLHSASSQIPTALESSDLQLPPSGIYDFASIPTALDAFTSSHPEEHLEFRVEGSQGEGKFSNASLAFEQSGSLLDFEDTQPTSTVYELKGTRRDETHSTEIGTGSGIVQTSGSTTPREITTQFPAEGTLETKVEQKAPILLPESPCPKVSGHPEVESTMKQLLEEEKDIPQENLAHFLAFTEGPVTLEEVMEVRGKGLGFTTGGPPPTMTLGKEEGTVGKSETVMFLATWDQEESTSPRKAPSHTSIHHFCTAPLSPQLPLPLLVLSRRTHTRPAARTEAKIPGESSPVSSRPTTPALPSRKLNPPCKRSKTLSRGTRSGAGAAKATLSSKAGSVVAEHDLIMGEDGKGGKSGLAVRGGKMEVARDPASLLWTPAPPKLSLYPHTIHSHLFPKYQSPWQQHEGTAVAEERRASSKARYATPRQLHPIFRSVPAFSRLRNFSCQTDDVKPRQGSQVGSETNTSTVPSKVPLQSIHEDAESLGDFETQTVSYSRDKIPPPPPDSHSMLPSPLRRRRHSVMMEGKSDDEEMNTVRPTQSLPDVQTQAGRLWETDTEEYTELVNELERQKEQLVTHHKHCQLQQQTEEDLQALSAGESQLLDGASSQDVLAASGVFTSRRLRRQALKGTHRKGVTTGRARPLRRTKSALLRAQQARALLSQPPRQLKRSGSFPLFTEELQDITVLEPSTDYRRSRRLSEPSAGDFQALMLSHGASQGTDPMKWAYGLWWDQWFPEVLKECRDAVADLNAGRQLMSVSHLKKQKSLAVKDDKSRQTAVVSTQEQPQQSSKVDLDNIEPLYTTNTTLIEQYEAEVRELSAAMGKEDSSSMLAVALCRRGALLRKLGRLKHSKQDLDRALTLEPTLSDAYWHRHMLFLLQGNEQLALEDLSNLVKYNKHHFGAYRQRAAILAKQGNFSAAVYNYSQAITLRPDNSESYFLRAEAHEKRGEVESALSDYAAISRLEPANTEVLSRQAMHKFNKGLWIAASQNFTALLQRDPNCTSARIHRAKALYNMGRFTEALMDLSAAIHLDPNGAEAFYHRACLIRRHHPKQAVRDFSISLLLDDSAANVSTHIHRGILYTQMDCYDEALSDFESAIHLDPSLSSAHVCAGLVHLLHRQNAARAVRCFSAALAADPTCIRAYLCRAEAYKIDEKLHQAIQDYTRALHMEPNNPVYYLYKGELYLRMKEFDLAALHIRTAAKLSTGFDQPKTQKALVQSFLGNHEEAMSILQGLTRTPEVFSLTGKLQLKACWFHRAADSFREALNADTQPPPLRPKPTIAALIRGQRSLETPPTHSRQPLTSREKSKIHFLCGQSLALGGANKEAAEEFGKVLQFTPSHNLAHYERGVARLKAGNSKGVQDLNRALAINPQLFQALLTRAAYFGSSGRFTKAILNCNEAIKLVPNSVRAHLYRGSLRYHIQSYCPAIEDFTETIRLEPRHSTLALFNRALCYQATGQLQKALSDYSTMLLIQKSPDTRVLVNRGLLYLDLKDHINALFDFIEAGKMMGNHSAIFQAIGYCYHHLGDLESAVGAYSEAIAQDSSFVEALVGRGNTYMDYLTDEGNERSKADYQQALQLSPNYLPARVNLALLLQAEGSFQQSWNELTAALETNKVYAPALEARTIVSLQMGNHFGSLLDINAALKASPSAELYTNRGVIQQFMGDVVNAMRDYQQAANMDPHYPLAHFNAGNLLFQQRQFRQAITSYSQALERIADDAVLVNRGIAHTMVKETEAALEDFSQAIAENPYAAHAYFNRGNLYRYLGDYSSAEQDYKKALELQPDDWLAVYYCGEMLGKQQKTDQATEHFVRAAQIET